MNDADHPSPSDTGTPPDAAPADAASRPHGRARDRLFDLSLDLLSVASFDGWFEQVNPAWTRCLGWSEDELTSRPSIEFVHPDDRERTLAMRGGIAEGRTAREFENRYLCKDGSFRWLSWNVHPSVETREVFGVARDITERRRFEQQLLRAQRLESLATLAGGFAHDLNNVFAPILMAIDLLPLDLDPAERTEILANVEASAKRGARLVGQVLSFARGVDGARVEVDLRRVIPPVVSALQQRVPASIDVRCDLPHDLRLVVGDPQQLTEVLHSLCHNAIEAMPDGGVLSLTVRNVDAGPGAAREGTHGPTGAQVLVAVTDTGVGMAADVLARIFDPFFTTRRAGKGTGLGLSSALSIVEGHGGRIEVESAPGQGATFSVALPALDDAVPSNTSDLPHALAKGRGQVILVVDDEASVRLMTRRALEAGGYKVLLAADGAEALASFRANAGTIALVLTDMRMPVMDGAQTLAALRQVDATVPIVIATGVGDDTSAVSASGSSAAGYLTKPYTTETLLATLHDVLGTVSTL